MSVDAWKDQFTLDEMAATWAERHGATQ